MSLPKKASIVYWLGTNLYINLTNRCPNACYFCFRKFKKGIQEFNLTLRKEPSVREVIQQLQQVHGRKRWNEVVFCGFGEPLERLDCVLAITGWVKKYWGMPVRVDTNGQGSLLNRGRAVVKELKNARVDRVSVSLNAQDEATYNQICNPRFGHAFEAILEFIDSSNRVGLDTEVTVVSLSEVDVSAVKKLAENLGVGFKARPYIPCFW